jgi:glucose uptake protein GlcU
MKASQAFNAVGSLVFAIGLVFWVATPFMTVFEFLMVESTYLFGFGMWMQFKERHR